jgi:hypothetical protein
MISCRPALVLGAGRLQPLQVLQQDEVEDALALPEVVLGDLDERAQKALEADDEAAEKAAVAADGERVVPRPQPPPVGQVARGVLDEEVAEGRGAALGTFGTAPMSAPRCSVYSAGTTETITSATTSAWSSMRTG